jgi:hypothetical protein
MSSPSRAASNFTREADFNAALCTGGLLQALPQLIEPPLRTRPFSSTNVGRVLWSSLETRQLPPSFKQPIRLVSVFRTSQS